MGTFALISSILAILSSIGAITSKQLQKKDNRENVNALADTGGAAKGIGIASDISGLASTMLGFVDGFGSMARKPTSTALMNSNPIGNSAQKIIQGFKRGSIKL